MPKKIAKKATAKKSVKKTAKKTAKTTKSPVVSEVKFQPHKSVVTKNDPVRWNRIEDEIIVDAHDKEELISGWFYSISDYIDNNEVRCRCRKKRSMSPLEVGEEVNIIEIAPFGDCESEMFVVVSWSDRKLAVPLEQLEPIGGDPKAIEVIEDWLYWCLMGYEF